MTWLARRLPIVALFACAGLFAIDVWLAQIFVSRVLQPDFYVYYLAADLGLKRGWTIIYDPSVFYPVVTSVVGRYLPYLNPPPLAWLVAPLTWLPYVVAEAIWTLALALALVVTWWIASPSGRMVDRLAYLVAAAAALPVFVSFLYGEVTLVIVAVVVAGWWLLDHGRPWQAGLVLALIALKPQVAFLVPVALLIAGHWRMVVSWIGATAAIAAASLVVVWNSAIPHIQQSLQLQAGVPGPIQVSLVRQVHGPVIAVLVLATVAALFVLAARSAAVGAPALPVAAGLVGSALLSPYFNFYDLAGLVLAAWLTLRSSPPTWLRAGLVVLYPLLYLAPLWPIGILVGECAWLASLVIPGRWQRHGLLQGRHRVAPQMPPMQAAS